MKDGNYYLYCHTNKVNGKKYIGISCQSPSKRWGKNGNRYKGCPKMESAIAKYGWDNFDHEILLTNLTQVEACEKEKEYIIKFDTIDNGYNVLSGGFDCSENGGELYFNSKKVNQYTLDKQLIKVWNSSIDIEKELGYNHSAISSNCRREAKVSYGYIWRYSDDCDDINDIELTNVNCFHNTKTNRTKPINQYDLNGDFIKQWSSILEASKSLNKPTVLITKCCNREPKAKTAYGYQWRYIEDCDDISEVKYERDICVYEIDINNNILHTFKNIKEAEIFYQSENLLIYDVLYKKQKTTHGHIFVYEKDYKKDNVVNVDNIRYHNIYVMDLDYNIIDKCNTVEEFRKKYIPNIQSCSYIYQIIKDKKYESVVYKKYHICEVKDYDDMMNIVFEEKGKL